MTQLNRKNAMVGQVIEPINSDWDLDPETELEFKQFIKKERELEALCRSDLQSKLEMAFAVDAEKQVSLKKLIHATFQRIVAAETADEVDCYKESFLALLADIQYEKTGLALSEIAQKVNELYLLRLSYLSTEDSRARDMLKVLLRQGAKTILSILRVESAVLTFIISGAALMTEIHSHEHFQDELQNRTIWQRTKDVCKAKWQEAKRSIVDNKNKIAIASLALSATFIVASFFFPPLLILEAMLLVATVSYAVVTGATFLNESRKRIKSEKQVDKAIADRMDAHESELEQYIAERKLSNQAAVKPIVKRTWYGRAVDFSKKHPVAAIFVGLFALVGGALGFELATVHVLVAGVSHLASTVGGGTTAVILAKTALTASGAALGGTAAEVVSEKNIHITEDKKHAVELVHAIHVSNETIAKSEPEENNFSRSFRIK